MHAGLFGQLPLQTRLPCPSAFQIIPHFKGQTPEPFSLDLDRIPIHEWIEPAVIGPSRQDISGLESMNRGDPLDTARNLVSHIISIKVLH